MHFHFTHEISIEGRPGGLALDLPESCCNCGATETISWVDTTLVRTTFVPFPIMIGSEITLPIRLPSCPQCTRTINRLAPTLTGFALLTLLVLLVALFPGWALAGLFVETGPKRFELTLCLAPALVVAWQVLWYGGVRRPRKGQTTAYQPVRLVGVRRRWMSGDIRQFTLKFTNDAYRASFLERNPELLRAKVVRVK
ncbi:hypothetical protein [Polyangium fumosum]|uniref:Uncharacterized protein n=1 Tax=Polyangium fumosum TaxID=889272 RepID=A0A4V5PKA3_9BACT|nr:hypothetical protein [Polyangium fumosum]TKC94662.1 hypothetical protein E8A74_48065 [Polyangium fumosum]